jgi:hypothetical protein
VVERRPHRTGRSTRHPSQSDDIGPGVEVEEWMNQTMFVLAITAADDSFWGPHDAHGRRRPYTAEELDALADFRWRWPDVKGAFIASANAIRSRLRQRVSNRISLAPPPPAEATPQG